MSKFQKYDNPPLTLPIRMRCSKKADHLMTSPFKASSILGISANVSVFQTVSDPGSFPITN